MAETLRLGSRFAGLTVLTITSLAGCNAIPFDELHGCQGYHLGQTLPSPGILRDNNPYFPKATDFPLTNELNSQQQAEIDKSQAGKR